LTNLTMYDYNGGMRNESNNNESNSMPTFITLSYALKLVPVKMFNEVMASKTRRLAGGMLILTYDDRSTSWIMLEA